MPFTNTLLAFLKNFVSIHFRDMKTENELFMTQEERQAIISDFVSNVDFQRDYQLQFEYGTPEKLSKPRDIYNSEIKNRLEIIRSISESAAD